MLEIDIAWLAGLLEGEGCFHVRRDTGRPLIKLGMTDEDVIARAALLMAASYSLQPRPDPLKDMYVIYVSNEKARSVMRRVRPYMGTRRSAAILKAIGPPVQTLWEEGEDVPCGQA